MAPRASQLVALVAALVLAAAALVAAAPGGGEGHHKKVIIHVPYHIKKIHHTHTVYKIIKEKDHGHGGDTFESWGGDGGHDFGHGWH